MSTLSIQLKKIIPSRPISFRNEWSKLTEELLKTGLHPKIIVDFQSMKNTISSESILDEKKFKLFCETCSYAQKELLDRSDLRMVFKLTYMPPFALQFDCQNYWLNEDVRDEILEYLKKSKLVSDVTRERIKIMAKRKTSRFLVDVKAKSILIDYVQNPKPTELKLLWNIISIPQLHYLKDGISSKYDTYLSSNYRIEKMFDDVYAKLKKTKLPPSQKFHAILRFSYEYDLMQNIS